MSNSTQSPSVGNHVTDIKTIKIRLSNEGVIENTWSDVMNRKVSLPEPSDARPFLGDKRVFAPPVSYSDEHRVTSQAIAIIDDSDQLSTISSDPVHNSGTLIYALVPWWMAGHRITDDQGLVTYTAADVINTLTLPRLGEIVKRFGVDVIVVGKYTFLTQSDYVHDGSTICRTIGEDGNPHGVFYVATRDL